MNDESLLLMKARLEVVDLKTIELFLQKFYQFLTLRTFIRGYTLGTADEQVWTVLRRNKVALGLIRRAIFPNLTRWFSHIECTYPDLRPTAGELVSATNTDATANQTRGRYNIKLQATENGVVTRFPPEPSGYLHIGHAKAAFLNDYFAHDAFSESLILRFDDTNPTKENQEFEDSILHDLGLLGIKTQRVTYTSDYFEKLYDLCCQIISDGNAYAEDTDSKIQKDNRRDRLPSKRRDRPASESLAIFKEMREGTKFGKGHCIRARIAFDSSNGSMRDPIIYRFPSWDAEDGPRPHRRTGWDWNIYPTYDFACPLVDSIEGVTHALRTTEYPDRNEQYYWFLRALKLRPVYLWDFARINFIKTFLSKRKLAKVVESERVDGWDDPRMPTIRGILRRGLTVAALREFMLKQGPSRNVVSMDWTTLWAMNKKIIEPIAPRHTAVASDHPRQDSRPKHPKNHSLGTKDVTFANQIYIEPADAAAVRQGEEITLMSWGNALVRQVTRSDDQAVTGLQLELHLDGDASKTDRKVHWLAAHGAEIARAELWEFDYLLTKDSLVKGDELEHYLNPVTSWLTDVLVGSEFSQLMEGDIIQIERKGYFRMDKPIGQGPSGKAVLFKIPTGNNKG
ncbi:glutamyl-tRNA synthetase [Metarhizium anisopliae]